MRQVLGPAWSFVISADTSRSDTYTFKCPVCAKMIDFDYHAEPCCTGPSESRNEHELAIMSIVAINGRKIDPARGRAKADGPLIVL